jgi:hypothetical protein
VVGLEKSDNRTLENSSGRYPTRRTFGIHPLCRISSIKVVQQNITMRNNGTMNSQYCTYASFKKFNKNIWNENHKEHWYWFPTHVVKELEKDLHSGSTCQS